MNVAVIGGLGRMGRWLSRHFKRQGFNVIVSDIKIDDEGRAFTESLGAKLAKDNIEAVREADITLISTPIRTIPEVLREVTPHLRRGSVIAEIASLKSDVTQALRGVIGYGVKPLSIHPLFGPGVKRLKGERIALIPIMDQSYEAELARKLFPGAEVVIVDSEEHDRAMAITLSLSHFLNIIFAYEIGCESLSLLKKLGGPTFIFQMILSESVMSEDPSLYASIQMNNKYTTMYLDRFLEASKIVREWIVEKREERFINFYREIQDKLSKHDDLREAYRKVYRALKVLLDDKHIDMERFNL